MTTRKLLSTGLTALALSAVCGSANAQLTYSLTWGWAGDGRQDTAWWSLNNVLARYNAYGDFTGGNGSNVQAAYNAGVPTAQANYGGWGGIIEYGGTWPNERVTLHELDHWLGAGTYSNANGKSWNGTRAVAIIEQFEGIGASVGSDGIHHWPYGMNYDSEWNELDARRNIALMYALRADWGIGSTANPTAWNATTVSLTGSDSLGQSGFNHYNKWSDGTFAHSNADYFTGDYYLRTPSSDKGFKFAGKSLTINNTNGINGGLIYKGTGTTGTVIINDLILDNGYVRHANGVGDLFRLAGGITLVGTPMIDSAQGAIVIDSTIVGAGTLTKIGGFDLTLTARNYHTGGTVVNNGTLNLDIGGWEGTLRGQLDINSGTTVKLNAVDALGWGDGRSVSEINLNGGTLDNTVAGNNSYRADWNLTRGTMTSTGGGSYHIHAGEGYQIKSLASNSQSLIDANIAIRGANSTLTVDVADGAAASDLRIQGSIIDSPNEAGSNGLNKIGNGTLVLAGNNTYSGNTTVNAGTLVVDGSLGTGDVIVNSGATLSGSGSIGGHIVLNGSAIFAPGNSPGTLSLGNSDLTLSDTSTLLIEITGTGAGTYDRIIGIDAFNMDGVLSIELTGDYAEGTTWDLFDFNSSSGNFSTVEVNGSTYGWAYNAGTGELTFTNVPEPTTAGIFVVGVLWLSRRRR